MPVDGDPPQDGVGGRVGLPDPQGRGIHQLDGRGAGVDEGGEGAGGPGEVVEDEQPGHRVTQEGDGAHDDGGDECERALAADGKVGEDVDGSGVVEEAVEPVAHRVLHRELLLDRADGLGVAADPVAQAGQAGVQLRLEGAQPLVGIRGAGVDDGAARQDEDEAVEGRVRVGGRAAGHPARVVGDDPTEGAGDLARRVGPELAPVCREPDVDLPDGGAGPDPDPGAAVEDLDVPEVLAGVHQHPVRAGLAGQARPAGPEGQRHTVAGRGREQPPDLRRVDGHGHGPRGEGEVGRVVRHLQPVDRTRAQSRRVGEGRGEGRHGRGCGGGGHRGSPTRRPSSRGPGWTGGRRGRTSRAAARGSTR